MKRWARIEEELSQFITSGGLMDEELRHLTAELLFFHLYDSGFDAMSKLKQSGIPESYPNWNRLIVRLLKEKALQELTFNNEDFSFSIARETLAWCKNSYKKFETTNDYIQEENDFQDFKKNYEENEFAEWEALLDKLSETYPKQKLNWTFYEKTLTQNYQELKKEEENQLNQNRLEQDLNILKQNVLDDWWNLLHMKKNSQEEEFLEKQFAAYFRELQQKVGQLQELGDLLSPFYNFLGHIWNDSIGNWNRINWDGLEEYAESIRRDPQLRELAELLGRWQRAEQVIEERKMQKPMPKEEWKPNPTGKSEITGIHHSDDLSHMLPSEIALLSTTETEVVFSKKYVEKKLLTFQFRADDIYSTPEIQESQSNRVESDQRGPIIMCIDTSGSMFGHPERVAKALALAILNLALKQKRQAYLISFSTGIQTLELTGISEDLTRLIDFLKMSFHGGTDIQPALTEALHVLRQDHFKKADVLVISDFIIPRIDRNMFNAIQTNRLKAGTRFHSLFITRKPDPSIPPLPIFDNHWIYDLDNPGVMRQTVDHFQTLEETENE